VPVPQVNSLTELNERLTVIDAAQGERVIARSSRTVGADFAHETGLLAPLPGELFEVRTETHVKVDTHARVSVYTNWYSVSASLIGRQLLARISADRIELLDGPRIVARHEWIPGRCQERLRLDDYLEQLARKPGALPGSVQLAQARGRQLHRRARTLVECGRRAHGDAAGTKEPIEVLLAHRHIPHDDLTTTGCCGRTPRNATRTPTANRSNHDEHRNPHPRRADRTGRQCRDRTGLPHPAPAHLRTGYDAATQSVLCHQASYKTYLADLLASECDEREARRKIPRRQSRRVSPPQTPAPIRC
jgi:hypothetical protein